MEKLRTKLTGEEATFLMSKFYIIYKDYQVNNIEDIGNRYLLGEVLNRIIPIHFKGGRLSLSPAEAVALMKVIYISNITVADNWSEVILQDFVNKLHKYLTDLL